MALICLFFRELEVCVFPWDEDKAVAHHAVLHDGIARVRTAQQGTGTNVPCYLVLGGAEELEM